MGERWRKIIHVDMDCFYAAVEVRDDPSLVDKPVAVGGAAERRGVLTTANYEARKYGLHSAMATATALRLCPDLVLLPVRMSYYASISKQIREIFSRYTDKIEPLSLDEGYLDVSDSSQCHGSATLIADDIRRAIKDELNLTASAGVAPNKFLAKICSEENKPDGQFVVTPDEVDAFSQQLDLRKFPGVGKVTLKKLHDQGLRIAGDVREFGEAEMVRRFGAMGRQLYERARGIDDREVMTHRIRKSLSVERTFAEDIPDPAAVDDIFDALFEELRERLGKAGDRAIRNQQVKLKFADFRTTTIERHSLALDRRLFEELIPLAWERGPGKGIRLLGIGVTFREREAIETSQLTLF